MSKKLNKKEFIQRHYSSLFIGVLGLFSLVIVTIYYWDYSKEQSNINAAELFSHPMRLSEEKQYEAALFGNEINVGFLDIIKMYPHSKAAHQARLVAASIYFNQSKYKESIALLLDSCFPADKMIEARKFSLLGAAYYQDQQIEKAIEAYRKAASCGPNGYLTPDYLTKLAQIYEYSKKDYVAAMQCYEEILELDVTKESEKEALMQLERLKTLESKKNKV